VKEIIIVISFFLFSFGSGWAVHSLYVDSQKPLLPVAKADAPRVTIVIPTSDPDQEMETLLNKVRQQEQLPPLLHDGRLAQSAKDKACDMEEHHYFAHLGSDGQMSWHWMQEEGFNYLYAGENLAKNYDNATQAMVFLMASPEHRENILSPRYQYVGMAHCGGYTVQHFGSLIDKVE
jgi:uncharacterized protein YkwD